MPKKTFAVYSLIGLLFFVSFNSFSQSENYRTHIELNTIDSKELLGGLIISGENILFNASNDTLYSIQKESGKINWQTYIGKKSNKSPYIYQNTFFYECFENEQTNCYQFDLNTGKKIKKLSLESLHSKPYFVNQTMFVTALQDGGKMVAYDIKENEIIWQKNIGYGNDFQPIYQKDKIIANAGDDNWFEMDYKGNLLKTKSKIRNYIDTTEVFVDNYKFLTHDNKAITHKFLVKNNLSNAEIRVEKNQASTFILSEKQLLILGNNRKKVLQLDLEKLVSMDDFDPYASSWILETSAESIWFYYQFHLIHYDFKNNKVLRKVNLTKWNAHEVLLENKKIYLISKNDNQLYSLDFEPDQRTADMIEAKIKYYRCTVPDPKKIEAARIIKEGLNR